MVIFNSYVKLPEGITDVMWNYQAYGDDKSVTGVNTDVCRKMLGDEDSTLCQKIM